MDLGRAHNPMDGYLSNLMKLYFKFLQVECFSPTIKIQGISDIGFPAHKHRLFQAK